MAQQPTNAQEIQEGKFFAIISYISFLCIVSLLLKKENRFALYHGKQGLVLFVLQVGCFLVSIIPFLGALIKFAGFVLFGLFSLWGCYEAFRGKYVRLPIVSDIADKIVL